MSSSPPKSWSLLLDFSNAFNNISVESMFAQIPWRIPSIATWMESCYSCQPVLHLGQDSILSCVGVQQGDPLGPQGFALTLHPLIEKISAEVPGLSLNVWYLDDMVPQWANLRMLVLLWNRRVQPLVYTSLPDPLPNRYARQKGVVSAYTSSCFSGMYLWAAAVATVTHANYYVIIRARQYTQSTVPLKSRGIMSKRH